jgi:V8-like Glu-specific endopeptidase
MHSHSRTVFAITTTACFTTLTLGLMASRLSADELGVTRDGHVVSSSGPESSRARQAGAEPAPKVDFVNAKHLSLPIASSYTPERAQIDAIRTLTEAPAASMPRVRGGISVPGSEGTGDQGAQPSSSPFPGVHPGAVGDGKQESIVLGRLAPQNLSRSAAPAEFGTANLPFSTARADLLPTATNDQYPYRSAGKLFFLIGGDTFICSASLINKGIVVTAAHCVSDFGKKKYYSGWQFVPGYRDDTAPFGNWSVAKAYVLDSYFDGTDSCTQAGVVCQNDVAVLALNSQKNSDNIPYYAGSSTGWFAYGWNKSGFTSQGIAHVTQLGYPACLDNGGFMERTDSQATISPTNSNNTVFGSLMCGGSSGGPVLVNFGARPALTGTVSGSSPEANVVIGTTSWGSTDQGVKQMGTSPFTASNVPVLVKAACKDFPDAC